MSFLYVKYERKGKKIPQKREREKVRRRRRR